MNMRHYNAQIAGRESVELFTVIFFSKRKEKAAGLVMGCKKNGIKVWVPQYGLEGTIYINHTNKKNALNENYTSDFDFDPETGVLTNQHDPNDTIETFQPITVGIHVQELKGFRRELILSLLSSTAFKGEKANAPAATSTSASTTASTSTAASTSASASTAAPDASSKGETAETKSKTVEKKEKSSKKASVETKKAARSSL